MVAIVLNNKVQTYVRYSRYLVMIILHNNAANIQMVNVQMKNVRSKLIHAQAVTYADSILSVNHVPRCVTAKTVIRSVTNTSSTTAKHSKMRSNVTHARCSTICSKMCYLSPNLRKVRVQTVIARTSNVLSKRYV
jgi:hypothetical protein